MGMGLGAWTLGRIVCRLLFGTRGGLGLFVATSAEAVSEVSGDQRAPAPR